MQKKQQTGCKIATKDAKLVGEERERFSVIKESVSVYIYVRKGDGHMQFAKNKKHEQQQLNV